MAGSESEFPFLEQRTRDQRGGGAESAAARGSGLQADPCTKKVCTSTLWSYIVVEILRLKDVW
jgi:hypothetical protein